MREEMEDAHRGGLCCFKFLSNPGCKEEQKYDTLLSSSVTQAAKRSRSMIHCLAPP